MKIGINGVGRVAKALLTHWKQVAPELEIQFLRRSNGQWKSRDGVAVSQLPDFNEPAMFQDPLEDLEPLLDSTSIDVWCELTPTDLDQAEQVYDRVKTVLNRGISVIIANKAPILSDYVGLKAIADASGAKLGLSAVMGASLPSYALGYYGALGSNVNQMAGILNGTTNFILDQMEQGLRFEEALQLAQERGIAEPKWQYDVDGFDSGIKMAILASVLTNQNVPLKAENVQGIRQLELLDIQKARSSNKRYKLVARYQTGQVTVRPELFPINHLFYHVSGSNKLLQLETDTLSDMTVIGGKSGLPEVAASMHRDLLTFAIK